MKVLCVVNIASTQLHRDSRVSTNFLNFTYDLAPKVENLRMCFSFQ